MHRAILDTAGVRAGIGLLALCVIAFRSGAAPSPRPPMQEPTKIGRPANFSQAVGSKFIVEMRATPTTLKANERITLTIRVTAQGAWQSPPRRPDLGKLRAFTDRFDIQQGPPVPDRQFRKPPAWEFTYTLK